MWFMHWPWLYCFVSSARQRSMQMWLFHVGQTTLVRAVITQYTDYIWISLLALTGNINTTVLSSCNKQVYVALWVTAGTNQDTLLVPYNHFPVSYSCHQLDSAAHSGHLEWWTEQASDRLHQRPQHSTPAPDLRVQQPAPLTSSHFTSQGGGGCVGVVL